MRRLVLIAAGLLAAAPAFAFDMPTRKAGLWELKMEFVGSNLPGREMKQCTDVSADKLMTANFGGSTQESCSKHDVSNSGGIITVDSVCKFGEATSTSHAVISGSFDSAYTVEVTSKREGGRPMPGLAPGGRDAHEDHREMARSLRERPAARRHRHEQRHDHQHSRHAEDGRRHAPRRCRSGREPSPPFPRERVVTSSIARCEPGEGAYR